jgi:hypothetical protein
MGICMISTKEIVEALDTALDNLEGDFDNEQLLTALECLKLYPFVADKNKSVPKYTKAKIKLGEY